MTAKKVGWGRLNVPIEYAGRAITLPANPGKMTLRAAKEAIERKIEAEEQDYCVREIFDYHPHDAAVAFVKAMTELYGWASPKSEHTWFGSKPPTLLSVRTGPGIDEIVQVPIGQFTLPGCDRPIQTTIAESLGFVVHGTLRERDRYIILELATKTREILKTASIYKGKPIVLNVDSDGDLNTNNPPTFMDVSDITESNLLFDAEVADQIQVNLLVPLKETESCRKHGVPLKRGILLEGPYGTGKSLTARLTARTASENGWTFILLDKVQGLEQALKFARRYSPAVVFAEDVDRIIEERNDGANNLINTIDGVISKSDEIMVVLTTNFVEKIDPVILRPGRLDAVISLRAPNALTVEKLIRHYAGSLLPVGTTLTNAGLELQGQIPASIRECVERAKLGMIGRQDVCLAESDIVVSAKSMKNHLALLAPRGPAVSVGDQLAGALRNAVNGHDEAIERIDKNVRRVVNQVC